MCPFDAKTIKESEDNQPLIASKAAVIIIRKGWSKGCACHDMITHFPSSRSLPQNVSSVVTDFDPVIVIKTRK